MLLRSQLGLACLTRKILMDEFIIGTVFSMIPSSLWTLEKGVGQVAFPGILFVGMEDNDGARTSQANVLCRACGLCCTGHLFVWAKLRPAELDPAEALGLSVFRSDP